MYGKDLAVEHTLRSFKEGKLKMQVGALLFFFFFLDAEILFLFNDVEFA